MVPPPDKRVGREYSGLLGRSGLGGLVTVLAVDRNDPSDGSVGEVLVNAAVVVTDIDVLAISGGIYEDLPPTDPSEGSFVQNQRLAY